MISSESRVREIRLPSSMSGDWKRGYGEEWGTGIAKAAGNSYPLCLQLPRQSPTLLHYYRRPKMSKRSRRSRRSADAKPRTRRPASPQAQPPRDQEAVDGILVQIKTRELAIAGEQPGSIQKLPGYEIGVAIPEWDKNRSLVDSVRKGHVAQQKLLTKLQGEGASRAWMIERFNEVDKVVAATLTTVAERIRTRRWRERERGEALQRLEAAFHNLLRWSAKTTRYCQRAEQCTDPAEKETVLDAACLGILKVGELINKVERMQHGFWEDFRAAHFLDMRLMRNLIGHTGDLEGEDVIPFGTGIVRHLHTAILRTLFPEKAGPFPGGFIVPVKAVRRLEPSRPGDKTTLENSIAMVIIDDHSRFIINRVGLTQSNGVLISSSATGTMNVSIYAVRTDLTTEPGIRNRQE